LIEMQDEQNLRLEDIPPMEPVPEPLEEGIDATSQPDLNNSVDEKEGSVERLSVNKDDKKTNLSQSKLSKIPS